jgi:adenylate kinase family enzyme
VPREVPIGRRVVIYGPSGSGKSTLSRALGAKLGLPVLELDSVFHAHPNWVDLSTEEFRAAVTEYLAAHPDAWVIDGNYSPVHDLILPLAETAIWLDLPWRTVFRRLTWRTLSRSVKDSELWNGNRETLHQAFMTKDSILLWGITAWRPSREKIGRWLRTEPHHARVYILRTPGQVRYLLANATAVPEPATIRE